MFIWQARYDGTELIFKFRLPTVTREVGRHATVEHTEAVFRLITEPNRVGRTIVWPMLFNGEITRCGSVQ